MEKRNYCWKIERWIEKKRWWSLKSFEIKNRRWIKEIIRIISWIDENRWIKKTKRIKRNIEKSKGSSCWKRPIASERARRISKIIRNKKERGRGIEEKIIIIAIRGWMAKVKIAEDDRRIRRIIENEERGGWTTEKGGKRI